MQTEFLWLLHVCVCARMGSQGKGAPGLWVSIPASRNWPGLAGAATVPQAKDSQVDLLPFHLINVLAAPGAVQGTQSLAKLWSLLLPMGPVPCHGTHLSDWHILNSDMSWGSMRTNRSS